MKLFTLFLIIMMSYNPLNSQNLDCINVKYKLRGYLYAASSQADTMALGGFYEDNNRPKKIDKYIGEIASKDEYQLIVKTDSITAFNNGIKGYKLYLINNTDTIVTLAAQDSRLYIKRQVFYKNQWRDIEYLPSSWCGNSYHYVSLRPYEYWDFTFPCLDGKIEAKFRFILNMENNTTVISNEFDGAFNKRQLKKEQGHEPLGLMDPYNN